MDIYLAISEDHRAIKKMLEQLILVPENDFGTIRFLSENLADALLRHLRAKEQSLYNALISLGTDDLFSITEKNHAQIRSATQGLLRPLQNSELRQQLSQLLSLLNLQFTHDECFIFAAGRSKIAPLDAYQLVPAYGYVKAIMPSLPLSKEQQYYLEALTPDALKLYQNTQKRKEDLRPLPFGGGL